MTATAAEIQQIVALRAQGLTHKQVAAEMGITWRRAAYLHQTAMREQRHQQEEATVAGTIVPPRGPMPFRPLRLSPMLHANAARAAKAQRPMKAMGTTPSREWVD